MAQAIPRGYGSQCQGGAGVRGFSRSGKPRLLLKCKTGGAVFPHPAEFFFVVIISFMMIKEQEIKLIIYNMMNYLDLSTKYLFC